MSFFKTAKGTQLPFLNLRGKDYLQVAHRLVWLREEHPDWAITTEIVKHDEKGSLVKATIKDENGMILATAHKEQDAKGFSAHVEKAEAGAVGRALAFLGYGTAHAQELEEDESTPPSQLADSPQASRSSEYIVPIGSKCKGKSLKQCDPKDLKNLADFLIKDSNEKGKPLTGAAKEFIDKYTSFIEGNIKF